MSKDFNDGIEAGRVAYFQDARPVGDPTHMFARFAKQLPSKCTEQGSQDPTVRSKKPHSLQISQGMREFCYHAPTADILDALLRAFIP